MKTLSILFVLVLAYSTTLAQTWTWERDPKAGENVMIHITEVPKDKVLHLVYNCFDGTQLISGDIGIVPSEKPGEITAPVALHDHVSWIVVSLKDKYGEVISQDQKKVINDKALPKADLIEKGLASAIYGNQLSIDADVAEVTSLFRDAIQAYPSWLSESEVLKGYYYASKRAESKEDLDAIKNQLATISVKSNGTTETWLIQSVRIAKDMEDSTLQIALRKKLDKSYPKSLLAQEDVLSSFNKAEKVEDKIKIRDQFKSKYPVTKENTRLMDQMTSTLAQQYASKAEWNTVRSYVDQIIDPMQKARLCNGYAWTLSGESIESEAPDLSLAADFASSAMNILASDVPVPTGFTKIEWATNMDYTKGQYGDTYALILFKQGKYDAALDHQSFSVMQSEREDADMNERYAFYLDKAGHKEELQQFMDQIMVSGKASEKVKALHRKYWTSNASQDQLYDQYLKEIEANAKALLEEKVKKMWQNDDALPFTLKDLAGNDVSLSDYKGKTVILDFWATWCGPCKASFPGMKKAIEYYASDESVVFLFVDTWESGEDIPGRVGEFIKANKYPFHVIMDDGNKIVSNYKVSGIPTKFIIGPDQKIHFTAIGYSGNPDELVEELKTMIGLVKEGTGMEKS